MAKGLATNASAPTALDECSASGCAEIITIGMCRVSFWLLSIWQMARPSLPERSTSSTIRSGKSPFSLRSDSA